jgi:polysaccharide export outer membrane protein
VIVNRIRPIDGGGYVHELLIEFLTGRNFNAFHSPPSWMIPVQRVWMVLQARWRTRRIEPRRTGMSAFDCFSRIYLINLPERRDRLRASLAQLELAGVCADDVGAKLPVAASSVPAAIAQLTLPAAARLAAGASTDARASGRAVGPEHARGVPAGGLADGVPRLLRRAAGRRRLGQRRRPGAAVATAAANHAGALSKLARTVRLRLAAWRSDGSLPVAAARWRRTRAADGARANPARVRACRESRMNALIVVLAALLLGACSGAELAPVPRETERFLPNARSNQISFPERAELAKLEAPSDLPFRLGAGDQLKLTVWGRPELSSNFLLGPDGVISIPLAGHVRLAELTRGEAEAAIARALRHYYAAPAVTLSVEQYVSNRITVLGRVQNPGLLHFDGQATLLEALARAGALPVIDKQATLTRCAIFRGRERVIWVDLKHLLARGDPAYNIRLRPNDLVYIPDSNDTSVYVLGAVFKPGAYRLTPDMSVLDALAQAGGPNEDGALPEMMLYRASQNASERIPLGALVGAGRNRNFALEEGDMIYVPKSGIANVGYTLRQLLPGLSFLTFGAGAATPGK